MQQCSETELNDVEKQLSVVEKMIMDACDICMCLDASKKVPNIEGWPIAKVTVLLIDCKKEKCFLLYNSITKGVWSVIEKDVDISSQSSEDTKGAKSTLKKKRVIRKHTKENIFWYRGNCTDKDSKKNRSDSSHNLYGISKVINRRW